MSELDRQHTAIAEQREDFEEHVKKDDERFEELRSEMRENFIHIRAALDWLIRAEKGEKV